MIRRCLVCLLFSLLLTGFQAWAEVSVFFAPNGGWAPLNINREIAFPDGKKLAPTLNNAVLDLIDRTKSGGTIKIAMYAFSDVQVQKALIDAAFQRNIRVKVILDAVADWTKDIRNDFITLVRETQNAAPKFQKRNFQVKEIKKASFQARGRTRILDTGEEIFGTMHEKFGIFYQPGMKIPFDAFAGSSNISIGSDQLFSENRFVFRDEPTVARQFAEEFARLWNEYGEDSLGNAESEPFIPADPAIGGVRVIFNGEPIDEERNNKIDEALLDMLGKVRFKNGTIDILMFSFTHFQLAQRILEVAQRFPNVKIRIIMDQTQLVADEAHRGILGPYFEDKINELKLRNFEIRYKWRANIFYWEAPEIKPLVPSKPEEQENNTAPEELATVDPALDGLPASTEETKALVQNAAPGMKVAAIHWRNLILHHKVLMVNRSMMAAGSYNWSSSAERRNLENIMIFNGAYPGHQKVIDRMLAEFDTLWNSTYKKGPFTQLNSKAQVISGPEGRGLVKAIEKTLNKPNMKPIMDFLDKKSEGETFDSIFKATSLQAKTLKKNLQELVQVGLLFSRKAQDGERYGLSD